MRDSSSRSEKLREGKRGENVAKQRLPFGRISPRNASRMFHECLQRLLKKNEKSQTFLEEIRPKGIRR